MERLTIKQLSQLSLPADSGRIAALPPPEDSALAKATGRALFTAAASLLALWAAWLKMSSAPSVEEMDCPCPECGQDRKLDGWHLWNTVLLKLGTYCDFTVHKLWGADVAPSRHASELITQMGTGGPPRGQHVPDDALTGQFIFVGYRFALSLLETSSLTSVLTRVGIPDDRQLRTVLQSAVCADLNYLGWLAGLDIPREQQALCVRLMASVAGLLRRSLERDAKSDLSGELGSFSAIRLGELSMLSRRDTAMASKYGLRWVATLFEQQLALIMQSLGFFVVPTRTGERSVDLICISGDPSDRFSFLLEAKTSKKPYSLPTDDERALAEYISNVRRFLPTTSPLSFVLLIGPSPARTIGQKLERMQSRLGIAIRFCAAEEIAKLRELVPSLMPMGVFHQHVLDGPTVLPSGLARDLAGKYQQRHVAHQDLVRSMLGSQPPAAHGRLRLGFPLLPTAGQRAKPPPSSRGTMSTASSRSSRRAAHPRSRPS